RTNLRRHRYHQGAGEKHSKDERGRDPAPADLFLRELGCFHDMTPPKVQQSDVDGSRRTVAARIVRVREDAENQPDVLARKQAMGGSLNWMTRAGAVSHDGSLCERPSPLVLGLKYHDERSPPRSANQHPPSGRIGVRQPSSL